MTFQLSGHPLATDLADFVDGSLDEDARGALQTHIEGCRMCRIAVREATSYIPVPAPTLPASSAHLDPHILEALQGEPPEPQPGQLWRFRWEGVIGLGVVLSVEGDDVKVAPVGLDEWMADDYAIVVARDWPPIGIGFAVWVSLESVVPLVTMDICLGEVDILDQIAEVRQAYRRQVAVTESVLVGTQIRDATDERSQYRRQLALVFAELSEAGWLEMAGTRDGGASLVDLLRDIDPRELSEALDIDAPSTFDLMSGERLVSEEQAAVIANMVGVETSEILASAPAIPAGLLHELNHPVHRKAIEERAQAAGHSDREERLRALGDLLPAAARRAGDESEPLDWRRLVRDRFAG